MQLGNRNYSPTQLEALFVEYHALVADYQGLIYRHGSDELKALERQMLDRWQRQINPILTEQTPEATQKTLDDFWANQ